VAAVGDDDRRVAGPQAADDALRADLGDRVVLDAEVAKAGEVGVAAVGEFDRDGERDRLAGPPEPMLLRHDGELPDGAGARRAPAAGGDPRADDGVLPGIPVETPAAYVGDLGRRLEEDQTVVG